MTTVPPVDWSLAQRLGVRLLNPGPELSEPDTAALVAGLRTAVRRAEELVPEVSGLSAPPPEPPLVVDRATWLRWNVRLADSLVAPFVEERPTVVDRLAGEATAVQVAAALAWLSGRVLGQYDPYAEVPRLLLVAPTIATVEATMGPDRDAFRLWVCLHEVTHRYQFGQAPWLPAHLRSLIAAVVDVETPPVWRLLGTDRPKSLAEAALGPQGRATLADVTAVMSLLEGYADVMMDRTSAVPGVAVLRRQFAARREARGLDAVLRSLVGLDLKNAQYGEGAAFCRAVIDRVGVDGLNRVYEGVASLPSSAEIADPGAWVDRVC